MFDLPNDCIDNIIKFTVHLCMLDSNINMLLGLSANIVVIDKVFVNGRGHFCIL
jgi:hypothetical protein